METITEKTALELAEQLERGRKNAEVFSECFSESFQKLWKEIEQSILLDKLLRESTIALYRLRAENSILFGWYWNWKIWKLKNKKVKL